ncbi:FAD-dependent oxidoreductase [Natronoarchaeum mannanilyticum]|uniref:FAD-dependent oxidoreductase n=1 Tax=Natronoarchaeum mannanilyticum TaxID=926360 RepID=UPI00360837F8
MSEDTTPTGTTRRADDPESLWLATTPTTDYEPLDGGLHVDVPFVGGGIAGLTTALELKERGSTVAVVEADRVVTGATGHTTAKVTSQHGLRYSKLTETFDRRTAEQYGRANEAAIDEVERIVEAYDVDAQFRRTPSYVYAESEENVDKIREEDRAATQAGLPSSFVQETDLPFDVEAAVEFSEQAEFHPRKYLLGVVEAIHGDGSYVFEETRATDVDAGAPSRVETERGAVVADDVVVATQFPIYDRGGYFARTHPHRAYLLAVEIAGEVPEGMYYSAASPPATMRPYRSDGEEYLIVGGQSHEPSLGGPPTSERYRRCEAYARSRFDVESVAYRWSTHDYSTVDGMPYIGEIGPGAGDVYVATGFDGWGMTGSTVAGMLIADLIEMGQSHYADLFDPKRVTPKASAKNFFSENAVVGARFVGDRVRTLLHDRDDLPRPGEAEVLRKEGRPTGVYRDEDGAVHAVDATCPHMGCLVTWNDAERSWDCPCHGSRFDYDGEILSGPAVEGLEHREYPTPDGGEKGD